MAPPLVSVSRDATAQEAVLLRHWTRVWHAVFYGTLLLATALALADERHDRHAPVLTLAVLLAIWHAATLVRHEPDETSVRPTLVYCAGMLPAFAALVALHPAFLFVAFGLYGQLFARLPWRWLIPVGGLLTAVLIANQIARLGMPSVTGLIVLALVYLTAVLLALMLDAVVRQSRDRRQVIADLERTRAELAAAEWRAGALAERERLAGGIHDALAQGFVSVVMHLEALEQAAPDLDDPARRHLGHARRSARAGLEEARRLVWALRPSAIDGVALAEGVRQVVGAWSDETGIAAALEVTGAARTLGPEREVALLRAVQEGLANVRTHARARSVTVTLSYMADRCVLDVQDDGVGFTPDSLGPGDPQAGGFGLAVLRARVAALGGRVLVESAPGEGTTLVVEVPDAAQENERPGEAIRRVL